MKDVISMVKDLSRPKLLVRTAKIGAEDYRRKTHLKRVLGVAALPKSSAALMALLSQEAELNAARRDKDPTYRLAVHLDVLIAIIGETRRHRATHPA